MQTATQQSPPRPDRTRLYGVTHNSDGSVIRRQARALKCGIGVPKGKHIHVWIENGQWMIAVKTNAAKDVKPELHTFPDRDKAEVAYKALYSKAVERGYPSKLDYFTFLHPSPDGDGFVHDFDCIEAHGEKPTEINIFFTTNTPFVASYEWWAARKLKCWGDGINAQRVVQYAKTQQEKALIHEDGKWFSIIQGCASCGCTGAVKDETGNRICKPHGKLALQLANTPTIGATAIFDTTGFRSTAQLSSSINEMLEATGGGDPTKGKIAGIPLKLVLRPYLAYPNGKQTTLYAVNVEFRPESPKEASMITQAMLRHHHMYLGAPASSVPLLPAPETWAPDEEAIEGEIMETEFSDVPHETPAEIAARKKEELAQRGTKVQTIRAEPEPEPPTPQTEPPAPTPAAQAEPAAQPAAPPQQEQAPPPSESAPASAAPKNPYIAADDDLPEVLRPQSVKAQSEGDLPPDAPGVKAFTAPAADPPHFAKLRELEIKMKAKKLGPKFMEILGANGAEKIEHVPVGSFAEIETACLDALGEQAPEPEPPRRSSRFGGGR